MHTGFPKASIRTLFISDTHLGMRGTQVSALLDFLQSVEPQTIYLVGDIVDGWRLKKSWHWPPACNRLVQVLLERLRGGTRILYLSGNHDSFWREFSALKFGGIDVREHVIHHAADGKRYLVIHGDQYDVVVRHARWFSRAGDLTYNAALRLALWANRARQRLGLPNWSLSGWARANVGRAAALVTRFEVALSRAAEEAGTDGVICGHIHSAAMHQKYGVTYLNCGDWVEHCTALIEHEDGRFELVEWRGQQVRAPFGTNDAVIGEMADAAPAHRL